MSENNQYGLTVEVLRLAVNQLKSLPAKPLALPVSWYFDVYVPEHGWHRFYRDGAVFCLHMVQDELTVVELEEADAETIRVAARKMFENDGSANAAILKGAI